MARSISCANASYTVAGAAKCGVKKALHCALKSTAENPQRVRMRSTRRVGAHADRSSRRFPKPFLIFVALFSHRATIGVVGVVVVTSSRAKVVPLLCDTVDTARLDAEIRGEM